MYRQIHVTTKSTSPQRIRPNPRLCVIFRKMQFLYGELLAICPTPKMDDHTLICRGFMCTVMSATNSAASRWKRWYVPYKTSLAIDWVAFSSRTANFTLNRMPPLAYQFSSGLLGLLLQWRGTPLVNKDTRGHIHTICCVMLAQLSPQQNSRCISFVL